MDVSMIVAVDSNNGIGKGSDQLAYISGDLKRFKELTSGHTVVMGRKTFEALPNGALPNRRNVVITRNKEFEAKGVEVVHSKEEVLMLCEKDTVFIIGGGEIYSIFLDLTHSLYVTRINHSFDEVDSYFPDYISINWNRVVTEARLKDEKSGLMYNYINLYRDL